MEGWIKISSFDKLHQAELRRELLIENGIPAVLLNERDSMLLFGEIELYVEAKNKDKAIVLIEEFTGWRRVDTFIWKHQIDLVKEHLVSNNVRTRIIKRTNSVSLIPEFELYIRTEQLNEAFAILNNPAGWVKIAAFDKVKQAAYRVEKLNDAKIESLIINKRDDDFNLLEIGLFVESQNKDKAAEIISKFEDFKRIETCPTLEQSELNIALLENEDIKVIEIQVKETKEVKWVELWVSAKDAQKAKNIIDENKEWENIKTIPNMFHAQYIKELLDEENIASVIINGTDSCFLLGEINIFVEKQNAEKAKAIIETLSNTEIEEEIE